MNFAFSTNAFRKFSFPQAARAISKAGYSAIEIMCDTPHAFPDHLSDTDIENIRQNLETNNLEISNLNAFMMCAVKDFHHPSWIETDETFRQIRIDHTLNCIDLAAKLGAKNISTEPGGPLKGISRQTAFQIFVQGLEQVLPRAREQGVLLLIEPEPGLLIETSDQYISFMEEFSHPNLGLNLDIGHFFCVGEDPVETIIKLKDHACHYHLEDIPENREHRHILPGQGGIDIKAVLNTIERTGYKGFVTVELYPYLDKPEKAAVEARTYIRDICGYE
ncbi:MAG: sugar phosphate isomerase/epimerase family protein [Desulfobacterium sp.]|nr:sugar phosphate isomerase/epimerase family protein [Desulfobacterium sp.]